MTPAFVFSCLDGLCMTPAFVFSCLDGLCITPAFVFNNYSMCIRLAVWVVCV